MGIANVPIQSFDGNYICPFCEGDIVHIGSAFYECPLCYALWKKGGINEDYSWAILKKGSLAMETSDRD
jgi:ribosomal protein L37AE/L43A